MTSPLYNALDGDVAGRNLIGLRVPKSIVYCQTLVMELHAKGWTTEDVKLRIPPANASKRPPTMFPRSGLEVLHKGNAKTPWEMPRTAGIRKTESFCALRLLF